MNIIGDIGNTEVKICLLDKKFLIKKKIIIKANEISQSKLKKKIKFILRYKNKLKHVEKKPINKWLQYIKDIIEENPEIKSNFKDVLKYSKKYYDKDTEYYNTLEDTHVDKYDNYENNSNALDWYDYYADQKYEI